MKKLNFFDEDDDDKLEQNIFNNQNNNNLFNYKNYMNQDKDHIEGLYQDQEEEKEDDIKENEINNKKCSLDEHNEIDAIFYCQECRINMCNKCEKYHSRLLKNHHIYSLDKDINEIFTGLCTKRKHSLELEFYCKTHNQLCCAACISMIRKYGKGQHKNCEIYSITKIKQSKKETLENNLKILEELSNKFEPSIKELKSINEKIDESKEKLKNKISIIFTKIRNELIIREDKLYAEIDEKFNGLFFNDNLIRESEKIQKLSKQTIEKGKIKENEWDDEKKLSKVINDCINIENTMKSISLIYDKINKINSNKNVEIEFYPNNFEMEKGLLNEIKNFGGIKIVKKKVENIFDNLEK